MPRPTDNLIAGDAKLLYRVPMRALVDYLLGINQVELRQALSAVGDAPEGDVTLDSLLGRTHSDLIRVFTTCPSIPPGEIRRLHEEHRYKGMKSLYLYECSGSSETQIPEPASLNKALRTAVSAQQSTTSDLARLHLTFRQVDELDDVEPPLIEMQYTYIGLVQVVNPNNEYPEVHKDLRSGFVWLRLDDPAWVVVCAREDVVASLLAEAVEKSVGIVSKRIHIPKTVVLRLEPADAIRRAYFWATSTGTRRQLANPKMAGDEEAMREVRSREQIDDLPAAGFNQTIKDPKTGNETQFALGYSNDRGKLMFSRDLTTTEIRSWAPGKITAIFNAIREMRATQPVELLDSLPPEALRGVPTAARLMVRDIARAVLTCRSRRLSEVPFDLDPAQCLSQFERGFNAFVSVDCEQCQERTEILCPSCHATAANLRSGSIYCRECGEALPLSEIRCAAGHANLATRISELLYLIPTGVLLGTVADLLLDAAQQVFNTQEESFSIRPGRLLYHYSADKTTVSLYDMVEFKNLQSIKIPRAEKKQILDVLGQFKEKCSRMKKGNCSTCVSKRHGNMCYLRLFGLLDSTYVPRPHEGHEYADYSRNVLLDNHQMVLALAMKKGNPDDDTITPGGALGREINSQVGDYLSQGSTGVVGVSCPQRLADRLQWSLRWYAELAHKKIVFLGSEELCRIIYHVMKTRKLTLSDL